MLENKWNNIAPEVPQDFHEKFEETLRHIEQADAVNKKYKILHSLKATNKIIFLQSVSKSFNHFSTQKFFCIIKKST